MHPLGRIGQPEDIARAVLFFLDPKNSWITGQTLNLDGGLSALKAPAHAKN
jgi:NAD(P)-dependent dehydrogenase (short-subunit alcohol dehydrogenase family)